VTDRRTLVTVMAYVGNGEAIVYSGYFQHSRHALPQGVAVTIPLDAAEVFGRVNEKYTEGQRFSRKVWRIAFKDANVAVLNVECFGDELRLPKPEEMPARTMLAYGSSITHGAGALNSSDTYVEQLARLLVCDVLNKGLGGACFCEPGVADYFAEKLQWDFALMEIGINMVNTIPVDEYEKRLRYMLERVTATGKPIFLVTCYRYSRDYSVAEGTEEQKLCAYRETMRKVHADFADKNCYLIEGTEILDRPEYLTTDGIHPSSYGHMMMGQNLSVKMKGKLQELGVL
jgi:lysophospholipase L1-like esterase